MIHFVRSLIFFQDFVFLLGRQFQWFKPMDLAGVLQEVEDGDARAGMRSQLQVGYFIIPDISTSIILPHLCQVYHDHFVLAANDGEMERLGSGVFILGFDLRARDG